MCFDEKSSTELAALPCQHAFCTHCLKTMVEEAVIDTTVFLPRCCGPVEIANARAHLDSNLFGRYLAKKGEVKTKDKSYCHDSGCSAFIPNCMA